MIDNDLTEAPKPKKTTLKSALAAADRVYKKSDMGLSTANQLRRRVLKVSGSGHPYTEDILKVADMFEKEPFSVASKYVDLKMPHMARKHMFGKVMPVIDSHISEYDDIVQMLLNGDAIVTKKDKLLAPKLGTPQSEFDRAVAVSPIKKEELSMSEDNENTWSYCDPMQSLIESVETTLNEAKFERRKERDAQNIANDFYSGEIKGLAPEIKRTALSIFSKSAKEQDKEVKAQLKKDSKDIENVSKMLAASRMDQAGDYTMNMDTAANDELPAKFWTLADKWDELVSSLMLGTADVVNRKIVK